MAYNKLKDFGLDSSDMRIWRESGATGLFIAEVRSLQASALKALIKGGAKSHDEHASLYKAYEKVLMLIDEVKDLK